MLKIEAAWTKAGIGSCIHLSGPTKQDDLVLDIGILLKDTLSAKFVFITHGHIDHIGAYITHARAKSLSSNHAKYFAPPSIIPHLLEAKQAFDKLDDNVIPLNLQGISVGQSEAIGSSFIVKPFATSHRVDSQGYAFYHKLKGSLLPELRGKSSTEIKEMKEAGKKIKVEDQETLELVYTGDTTFEGLLNPTNSFIFTARTIILELTYLDGPKDSAIKWGHIHIQDIIDNAELFKNDNIVFVHLSKKYSLGKAIHILRKELPHSIALRAKVALQSFGAREVLTDVLDQKWSNQYSDQIGWGWANRNFKSKNNNNKDKNTKPNDNVHSQSRYSYNGNIPPTRNFHHKKRFNNKFEDQYYPENEYKRSRCNNNNYQLNEISAVDSMDLNNNEICKERVTVKKNS